MLTWYNDIMYHITQTVDKPEYLNPSTDTRNVADEFKGMETSIIRMAMDKRRVPAVTVVMNLTHDFNKASVLRAHEAHAFKEFVLINKVNDQDPQNPDGVKKFNKRGTVGTHLYANVKHTTNWFKVLEDYRKEGYTIFAVDNIESYNPKPIDEAVMPAKSVFVYGEEGLGLSDEVIEACDEMIYIPQFGVPRSLNIAQAASICMYEYARQNKNVYQSTF